MQQQTLTRPSRGIYRSKLALRDTEAAIKQLKDYFERALAKALDLQRVSAPLFVQPESGLNDYLNGIEKPVSFAAAAMGPAQCEIVQSLAKWKRLALKRYGFSVDEGLYTDMNAIRPDEHLDRLHSLYVDQWDWEKIIRPNQRNLETLQTVAETVYACFLDTEDYIIRQYPVLSRQLPPDMVCLTTQELDDRYPELEPKEREHAITREKGAVFLMQIGHPLRSGRPHDGRSPDYDDWNLNGDILFWSPIIEQAVELSSMGIRVDSAVLTQQLRLAGCEHRAQLAFHRELLAGNLPQTVGGGIGQSRLCMFFLEKRHIGEVQASVWPRDMLWQCHRENIDLL